MVTPVRARKSLGQHWLIDQRVLKRIADAADIQPDDTVVEIGPGKGALTRFLATRAARLILVEVDRDLAARLREEYAGDERVTLVEGDVLELGVEDILNAGGGGLPYVVVGNLPYFIGSPIVRKFLTARTQPRSMTVMLQAEVAERMASQPGDMSALGVETQLLAGAKVLFRIAPRAFRPPPKVQSAVLHLTPGEGEIEVDDREAFMELVHAGFAAPRKRLRNSLAVGLRVPAPEAGVILADAGVDPDQRPQMLSLEDWRQLYYAHRRHASTIAS